MHLLELAKAEKDGRLVVLPAKTVFELVFDAGPDCDLRCPGSFGDGGGVCDLCEKSEPCIYEVPCKQEHLALIGKTVFLAREEAEAAAAQKGASNETDSV